MPRYVTVLVVVAALCSVGEATDDNAGSPDAGRSSSIPSEGLAAAGDLSERAAEPAACTVPQDLSADEIEALTKLSAENAELADQSGGYVSNDDLVVILLVVLIVVLVF
jgi:hypothetical protein